MTANNRRRKDLYTLPHADKALLDAIGYRQKLQAIDAAILANADFLHKIVANPEIFGHDVDGIAGEDGEMEDMTLLDSTRRPSGGRSIGCSHWVTDSPMVGLFSGDDAPHAHIHSHGLPNNATPIDPRKKGQARYKPTDFDTDKLRSTLKQFVRDWSEDVRVFMIRRVTTLI